MNMDFSVANFRLLSVIFLLAILGACSDSVPPNEEQIAGNDPCSGAPLRSGSFMQSVELSSTEFPELAITYSTKEFSYTLDDACVPVIVEMTNNDANPITLNIEQSNSLNNMSMGFYRGSRFIKEFFIHESNQPVQPGLSLNPGENTYFSVVVSMERLKLYTPPPLGGGYVQSTANIQGPYSTVINDLRRFDFTYDIDYGVLPTTRIYEPGAGIDYEAGVINIGFNDGIELAQAEEIIRSFHCYIIPESATTFNSILSVQIPFDKTTSQMIMDFTNHPDIRYANRNYLVSLGPPLLI